MDLDRQKQSKMNALTVQNPRYKCDLGNKNDSVFDCNNTFILRLYYICACALQLMYTPVSRSY